MSEIQCSESTHRYDPPITTARDASSGPASCVCGQMAVGYSEGRQFSLTFTVEPENS